MYFTGITEQADGTKYWYKEGKSHRLDGPAVEFSDGDKCWFKEGKVHRENGPAIERSNGDKEWWVEGNLHRIDGPAIEFSNGRKEWWVDGKLYEPCFSLKNKIFLGKEKGKYGLEWYKFMTEEGIEEFPIFPSLEYKVSSLQPLEEFLKRK